jgi:hypothetical protein
LDALGPLFAARADVGCAVALEHVLLGDCADEVGVGAQIVPCQG